MNGKYDALTHLMIALLGLVCVGTAGAFSLLNMGDLAILAWALAGLLIAVTFARPFPAAGAVTTVIAVILFIGAQFYRMASAMGIGLDLSYSALESTYFPAMPNYLPIMFIGALCFTATGWLSDGVARQLVRIQAQLMQNRAVIRELTLHDDLTGTLKRVYADKALSEEIVRARRYSHNVSVVLLSADDWGGIVKDRGQDESLQALKMVGKLLRENLRTMDTVSRYDETGFVAILPETQRTGAQISAERLCQTVAERTSIHFRAGVAEFPGDAASKSELMSEAAAALKFARNADITVASHGLLAS
ncbi:MAG: GGDEF domain-containing protein [Chloroflexi bacterium]|nr:GGDEF domain-containing protein [Chloroflexota bacterium]